MFVYWMGIVIKEFSVFLQHESPSYWSGPAHARDSQPLPNSLSVHDTIPGGAELACGAPCSAPLVILDTLKMMVSLINSSLNLHRCDKNEGMCVKDTKINFFVHSCSYLYHLLPTPTVPLKVEAEVWKMVHNERILYISVFSASIPVSGMGRCSRDIEKICVWQGRWIKI